VALTDPAAGSPLEFTAEQLFDEAPCGYLTLAQNGCILRANKRFADWTGYHLPDLPGRTFQSLLSKPGQIYFETHFAPLLRMQGEIREVAFDVIRNDGTRLPVLTNSVQKQDGEGRPAVTLVALFNSTDRRRYEQELLVARNEARDAANALKELNEQLEARVAAEVQERMRAEEALRQAQKMEAVGQLTGGVAHDFNNLLTVIIGSLDNMNRELPRVADEAVRAKLQRMRDMAYLGSERAARLTSRLLAFARRKPLDPKPINVNDMLAGISELLRRTIGEQVSLEFVGAGGLWSALVDQPELENVVVNLAVNARDAMPEGGRLTIETRNVSLDDAYVEALGEPVPPGQYVLIAVSDTGVGMDRQTLERVFEPFFTTKEPGKGTGLGLSQVYGFVRQSNGHIRVYSEVGEGTTVKLYLPRSLDKAEVAEERRTDVPRGSGETVLVVEDHDELREHSADALASLGYRVLKAADAAAALEILRSDQSVDLLFTDVVLAGGMNGRKLADAASELRPDLRVLFTTGYTANAIVHNGRLDPGVALISKPFTLEQLARKVRQVLG
jgi:PAS domain S-box-containing protein